MQVLTDEIDDAAMFFCGFEEIADLFWPFLFPNLLKKSSFFEWEQ